MKLTLAEEGCQVVIVTRGVEKGARKWKEDTRCLFPIYLDTSRELYTKFSIRRSFYRVFCPDTMKYYIEKKLAAGAKFASPYPDVKDDQIQMGGDILFRRSGTVELAHVAQFVADRPKVENVLKIIREKNKS